MARLRLELIGCFRASTESGRSISFPTRKAKALLAFLAARPGKYHARSSLAALLWSDSPEQQARAGLRQTLTYLRRGLAPTGLEHLVVEDDRVCIDPETVTVDAEVLEGFVAEGTPEALEVASKLYRGPFLDGFDLRDDVFNEWLRTERARIEELVVQALESLLSDYLARHEFTRGQHVAQRLLAIDPLQERVHRTLMELHLRQGKRAKAIKQYEACREILQQELGIEPDDESKQLWRAACAEMPVRDEALNPPKLYRHDKPSIAILPFECTAGDTDLCEFAGRIVEDLIEGLSRVGWLLVKARSFPPGTTDPWLVVSQLGEWPECRYLLKGSVRRVGHRIRVTVRLIDRANDLHIWVEHFDRHLSEAFAVQDPLSAYVIGAIEPRLCLAEIRRAKLKPLDALEPYELVVRALPHLSNVGREDNVTARRYLDRAIEIDPEYAPALGYAACCNSFAKLFSWSTDLAANIDEGLNLATRAIDSSPDDPAVLRATGWSRVMLEGDHDRGFSLVNKALSIEPASAHGWAIRGWINTWYEQIDQGYADFRRAHRLSPSNGWSFLTTLGFAYTLMQMGRAEEGLQWARRICEDRPLWSASYRNLIACLVNTGQLEKARQIVKVLLELEPGLTISAQFAKGQYKRGAAFERFARALRQAGVPE